jgi:antitoxin ParD1/3/4
MRYGERMGFVNLHDKSLDLATQAAEGVPRRRWNTKSLAYSANHDTNECRLGRIAIMPTRNVVLTERHEKIIEALVSSGRYQNASEVLREGLRLLEQREEEHAAKLAALRAAAASGFDAIDQGRFRDIAEEDLAGHIAALGRRAADAALKSGA